MGYHASVCHLVGLERSLAIYWPFRPFLIPNTPGYIQFLCEMAILSDFHMLFGALDAIGSKICVVTSLTDWLGPFTMLIRESFLQTTSSFVLVGALERFSGVSQAFEAFLGGIDFLHDRALARRRPPSHLGRQGL
jgi:hypothetical protein